MGTGFDAVTPLAEAKTQLRECCLAHDRMEPCKTAAAAGRILATEIDADSAVPHYDRAAMDGYALRAEDTFDASDRSPVRLDTDEAVAGERIAVPVHTGSAMPDHADAVVMVEYTEKREDDLLVYDAVGVGENVAPAGEDIEDGQHLLDAGHEIRPSDLAVFTAIGRETVPVVERPRVSVIPTGEELVSRGTTPGPGEIVETNGLVVSTLVERWGGEASYREIVTDDRSAIREAITNDTDHDIVVTTGGSSVGDRDLVPDVVAELGEVSVHGVGVKPGHPVGFGIVDETPVLMLPGYPVSCFVNSVQLLRPAIAWRAGTEPATLPRTPARLTEKIPSSPGERTFARVELKPADDDSVPHATPIRASGAGVMSSITLADGWVEIPDSREGFPSGETVDVQRWE